MKREKSAFWKHLYEVKWTTRNEPYDEWRYRPVARNASFMKAADESVMSGFAVASQQ